MKLTIIATIIAAASSYVTVCPRSCPHPLRLKRGDTLGEISFNYRTPLKEIIECSGIENEDMVDVNQLICFKNKPVIKPCPSQCQKKYKIKPGDTLDAIMKSLKVNQKTLGECNFIENPNMIFAGATLCYP